MQEVIVRLKKDSSGSIGITLKASVLCTLYMQSFYYDMLLLHLFMVYLFMMEYLSYLL